MATGGNALTAFAGTYHRDADGVWRYPWGAPVPGARDVLFSHVLHLFRSTQHPRTDPRTLDPPDLEAVAERYGVAAPLLARNAAGNADAVVGMAAPEVDAAAMMTVADLAQAAYVSKATIDSYRYRGLLPEPQLIVARTPLWARPIVSRWLEQRPGPGWRTDVRGVG